MFREMRRTKQMLSREESIAVLEKGQTGILAVEGENGYPYAVPLNYVYKENAIYFHCAVQGHKLEGIKKNSKVSFCVVGKDQVLAEKFSTDYESVIVFGRAEILKGEEERLYALRALIEKYSVEYKEEGEKEIKKYWNQAELVKIQIAHMTGKKSIAF